MKLTLKSIFASVYTAAWRIVLSIVVLLLSGLSQVSFAFETEWKGGEKSQLRLIAAQTEWEGKQRLVAGIEIRLAPKWKTYWRTPGDSGIPPYFDWSKSENLEKAEVFYPVPARFKDAAGTSNGYETRVILPVVLTAQNPKKPIKLRLRAQYAICHDLCVPVSSDQILMIENGDFSRNEPLISMALDTLPKPVKTVSNDFGVQKVVALVKTNAPRLRFVVHFPTNSKMGDIFVEGPDNLYIPSPELIATDEADNQKVFEVDLLKVDDPEVFENIELICTVRVEEKSIVQPCKVE